MNKATRTRPAWRACCRYWWRGLGIAALGLSALCAASCKSTTRMVTSTQVRKDSVTIQVVESDSFVTVPTRTTSLAVDAALLRELTGLPEGFALTADSGSLHLRVEADGRGGLNVRARADSIPQQVVRRRETQTTVSGDSVRQLDEVTIRASPVRTAWHAGWSLAALILPLALIYLLYKRFSNTK